MFEGLSFNRNVDLRPRDDVFLALLPPPSSMPKCFWDNLGVMFAIASPESLFQRLI